MGAKTCRTQEELPAEPGSGFAGSSTVVSISMTRIGSGTELLRISLMHGLDNVLGRAAKAGRRPVIMLHYDLAASSSGTHRSCHCRCR